jgi:hypothetical protein
MGLQVIQRWQFLSKKYDMSINLTEYACTQNFNLILYHIWEKECLILTGLI